MPGSSHFAVANCLTSEPKRARTCIVPHWRAGTHINHWQGGKDMWKGRLKSIGAIKWKGNLKTNDRDTGGQISPRAEAAGPEVTGEVVGLGGAALIDLVWQLLISYQLHLWGEVLRFSHGLCSESVLWCYCNPKSELEIQISLWWLLLIGSDVLKCKTFCIYYTAIEDLTSQFHLVWMDDTDPSRETLPFSKLKSQFLRLDVSCHV